jgi:ring-1,2-phenylacetyl-CoA epoxidase subunit PaaD
METTSVQAYPELPIEKMQIDESIRVEVLALLNTVKDPEMPAVSLVELGMVHKLEVNQGLVHVELIPTFVGCPALELMRRNVEKAMREIDHITSVEVKFVLDIPWSSERITPEGREKLRQSGIQTGLSKKSVEIAPPCPYCGSKHTQLENVFGPTACRSMFYCNNCHQPFEGMKHV